MRILGYLLVPALVVTAAAVFTWVRNRQPTSLESGVDSFRREMDALSPDAAPQFRNREEPGEPGASGPGGPRRSTPPGRRPPGDRPG